MTAIIENRSRTREFAAWLRLVAAPEIVRRALLTALVVGTILTTVNHGPEILASGTPFETIGPILVTFLTPYIVATISSVATLRATGLGTGRRDEP